MGAGYKRSAQPRRAEDRLVRAIVEKCPDAIMITSADRRVRDANEVAAQLFGRSLSELLGAAVDDLVAPDDREMVVAREREAHRGHPQRYECHIVTAKGAERIVAVASAALRLDDTVLGTTTLRDVSEEYTAHDALARSEARYRHLFESASDAIVTFDAAGRFTTVNHAAEVISGYERGDLIGSMFAPMLPDVEIPKALREFQRALSGESGQFETAFLRKDGQTKYISVTYSCPQLGEEVLCLIRDVTQERQLQQQLMQSEKMAAIGQLVSGVAHELNNPLASVSAFAQLLLSEGGFPGQYRHSAEIIASEARRAARIVNNLLMFARQHKAEKVPAQINEVLDNTLELRTYELSVRGISLIRDYEKNVPETMADIHQLKQVFLNITTNAEQAMEAMERGHQRLTVRTRALTGVIRIEIEDTGPGIAPDSLQRIFNPFFTTKPTGSGTGLGLSISLGIVSEHGGRIWAENVAGGGSRFCVELPVVEPVRAAEPEPSPVSAYAAIGMRVLVVDDEEPIRVALCRYLSQAGHVAVPTGSGAEALSHAERQDFDAMILDIRMPDMSGKEVFERLRKVHPSLAERVIFLTGDTVSLELRRFLSESGRPFVAKPFEFRTVMEALPRAPLAGEPIASPSSGGGRP